MKQEKLIGLKISNLRHAEFTQFITRFLDDVEKEALDFKNEDVITALVKPLSVRFGRVKSQLRLVRLTNCATLICKLFAMR